jgi:hypothetical protein
MPGRFFSISKASTALNISWLPTIQDKKFRQGRYFEENDATYMITIPEGKGIVIPTGGQNREDVVGGRETRSRSFY